ncbi:MAG: SIR2 family protein [Candidatus Hatepunaea meridiana]|nr:SIR2 family protein [Candidatus Hatepunaea meridiana]
MNSYKDIDGNEAVIRKLREIIKSGDAIAFVGAGASAGHYPLWEKLIEILAKEALDRDKVDQSGYNYWIKQTNKRPHQVVRGIRDALGTNLFGNCIREIFRPKIGRNDKKFTETHEKLLRIPFKGYVTTNYDPGLLEARYEIRRDTGFTGYATWKDQDSVQRWFTNDIFKEEICPILFAHGSYEKSDTIVLGIKEYRDAYSTRVYRSMFEKLWGQDRLVFIGFGFSDTYLDFIVDDVITQTTGFAASEPRHIALLSLPDSEEYSRESREVYRDQYNMEVIYYPVHTRANGSKDYSELQRLLELFTADLMDSTDLTPAVEAPSSTIISTRAVKHGGMTAVEREIPQRWTHETTNDENYLVRQSNIDRLNRWSDDSSVKIVSVTGIGGLGKTSLIGYWLKERDGIKQRAYLGVFYWSFYNDRSVGGFLKSLLGFALESGIIDGIIIDDRTKNIELLKIAKEFISQFPLLIVLDGLEVIQERPDKANYGTLLDTDLRELLEIACKTDHSGLFILTSRFPFADMVPYLGRGFRALDLDRMTPKEGADLLKSFEVDKYTDANLEEISRRLEGHPLALRIFASTVRHHGKPGYKYEIDFNQKWLDENETLERKMHHLLGFYEECLPEGRRALLGVISLFRDPIEPETIATLTGKLGDLKGDSENLPPDKISSELNRLHTDKLLIRDIDPEGSEIWSCHPILRDHFRAMLLTDSPAIATETASFLTDRPSSENPKTIVEIRPITTAIELLIEAGNFKRADELFRERLNNGEVFKFIPAIDEGRKCSMNFVRDDEARKKCWEDLGERGLSFYINGVGLYAMMMGDFQTGLDYFIQSNEIFKSLNDKKNLSACYMNIGDLQIIRGELIEAEKVGNAALNLAREIEDEIAIKNSLSLLANVLARQGQIKYALEKLGEANMINNKKYKMDLTSIYGIYWADLMLHLNWETQARKLTENGLKVSKEQGWQQNIARCQWIFGRIESQKGNYTKAKEYLDQAENTFRTGQMIWELPKVLLSQAELSLLQKSSQECERYVEETLHIASPRGMKLNHADALVLRGRLNYTRALADFDLDSPEFQQSLERAQDDGEGGLNIAKGCGYAWAERDALLLLSDVLRDLGEEDKALQYKRDGELLARKLSMTEEEWRKIRTEGSAD